MQQLQKLPDLAQTINEIVIELLLLIKEGRFPALLFANDAEDETSVRLTAHYVMALLSYRFPAEEKELIRAADWFDTRFPEGDHAYVRTKDMNRLEVLLNVRPNSDNVFRRLKRLNQQRAVSGRYFDIQYGWDGFDTLWTLQIFTLAKRQQVLGDEIITTDEMTAWIDRLITGDDLKRDKDIALALHLQHDMMGALESQHEQRLEELIKIAAENNGVWGLREFVYKKSEMNWLHEFTQGRKLTYDDIKNYHLEFRKVILSTCMVIENLLPLIDDYPELRATIEKAIHIWWSQFQGQDAVNMLRALFPRSYDYILVLCRTLRTVQEYIGRPPCTPDTVHLLRRLTDLQFREDEQDGMRSIKQALRDWIKIDLDSEIEKLFIGYSDANVVRVRPHIWSPMFVRKEVAPSLITDSLIIKYGPADLIERERHNYDNIPVTIQNCFVKIPQPSYIDPRQNQAFVIMQDLGEYQTLYEARYNIIQHINPVADHLGAFLMRMHESGSMQYRPSPRSLVRDLYLQKLIPHTDRIFNFIWENNLLENTSEETQKKARTTHDLLFERIGEVISRHKALEILPSAYMHGDLHMRNIMVLGMENLRQNRERGLEFKLIDLENLSRDGDAAFDAGELVIDIELTAREEGLDDNREKLLILRDKLQRIYDEFSRKREDAHFGVRMELAKARALLRVSKGKVKRGEHLIQNNHRAKAERIALEVIEHAEEAVKHFQLVIGALSR